MSSGRRSQPLKTETIIKIVIGVVILAIVLLLGITVLRKLVTSKLSKSEENEVQSAQVTTGSISTTVTGSGTLSYDEEDEIILPSTVEVEEYYVSAGDVVEKGDLLASVKTTTLVSAMYDLQEEIDEIDEDLADAEGETVSNRIDANVSGRIKKIYAKEDDDVASVMYDKGSLALLSLDGLMCVEVETDALKEGDAVEVVAGGETYDGFVEKVISDTATVTLTDDGPEYDGTATVSKDSKKIGTGKLAIHKPLSVTGYAGTVSDVNISDNQKVSSGTKLFTLTDTSYTANYDSLLAEREKLEDKLEGLVTVYKEGAVYAQEEGTLVTLTKGSTDGSSTTETATSSFSGASMMTAGGSVSSSSASKSTSSSTSGTSSSTTASDSEGTDTVFAISPNTNMNVTVDIDESDILSIQVGQEAQVTIDSLDDEEFTGKVTEVGSEGTSSNGVTTYSTVISIEKNSSMLAGMSASASISIDGKDDAILIPKAALKKTRSSAYVYTSYDEDTGELGDMVEVTVGISNDTYVEIQSGLSEGQTVYYQENSSDENSFGGMQGFGGDSFPGGGMPSGQGFSGGDFSGSKPSGSGQMPGRQGSAGN